MGEEPQMCCDGRMCGCMGQPTEPIVCSEKCYYGLPHMQHGTWCEKCGVWEQREKIVPCNNCKKNSNG